MVIYNSVQYRRTQGIGDAPLADHEYCRQLAADFSIPSRAVLDSLSGQPIKQAYKIARWAGGLPQEERVRALRNWAKKHEAAIYRPQPEPEAPTTQPKPKKRESRFSGEWWVDVPSAKTLERMEGVA